MKSLLLLKYHFFHWPLDRGFNRDLIMKYMAIFLTLFVISTGVMAVSPSEEIKSIQMLKTKDNMQKQK